VSYTAADAVETPDDGERCEACIVQLLAHFRRGILFSHMRLL
jgi:hypothetical protein